MAKKKTEVAHSERAHAILGASSSHIWLNCPGAVRLWAQVPKKEAGVYAEEGTAAHELAELVLTKQPNAHWYVGKKDRFQYNGIIATEEMAEHVQTYADYVINARNECEGELMVEEKFDLGWLYPGMFGTNDAMIYDQFDATLEVIDFKYGAGVPVEVANNSQLIYYALGGAKGREVDNIKLTVVQPRCEHKDGPIRSWTMNKAHLMEWAKKLKAGAIETTKKDAEFNAGDHCRFCNAAGVCPKLAKQAVEVAKADFTEAEPKLPQVEKLTDSQLMRIVQHKGMIESFLKEATSHARERLIKGEKIDGLKLVKGRGRRAWHPERASEDELVKLLGDDIYCKTLLSPSKAEKHFGKDTVKDLWVTIEGSVAVAHESDRRKAIAQTPKDDFGQIEAGELIDEDMF
jgi:hypothetical protein